MKKIIFIIAMLLIFTLPSLAENILLKNGTKITNVKIIKQDSEWIYYQMTNGNKTKISKKAVLTIEKIPFVPNRETKIIAPDFKNLFREENTKSVIDDYPNFKFITLSIVSFVLGYDYFKQSNNIQKTINFNDYMIKNSTLDDKSKNQYLDLIENLKNEKERKQLIGAILITSGIINAIISFKKVQVKATTQKLTLSYKF